MTPKPAYDTPSMCSMLFTVVVSARWNGVMMRPAIWSGGRPVNCHTTLITGMLISGKMSVGVRSQDSVPAIRISSASTTNVYGRRSAIRTRASMASVLEQRQRRFHDRMSHRPSPGLVPANSRVAGDRSKRAGLPCCVRFATLEARFSRSGRCNDRRAFDPGRVRPLSRAQARAHDAPQAFCKVPALQRLAQDLPDPDGARTLKQLSAAVAAHQHDIGAGRQPSELACKFSTDQLRHRLIGENDVEALRRLAKCLQRLHARAEADRL